MNYPPTAEPMGWASWVKASSNEDNVMAIIDNDIFLKEKYLVSEDVIKIGINYFTDFKKNKLKPHSL